MILSTTIKVRSYELDSFGHVNNATFLNYLEAARGDYLEQMGLSFNDFARWESYPVIVRHEIEYKAPAHYGDELLIEASINKPGRSSMHFVYTIYKQKRICVAEAMSTLVFVGKDGSPISIPTPFRQKINDFLARKSDETTSGSLELT
ncbi:MAG TPA: acyl-CoA thioesterase [Candidatus Marinimicrobia bacterium]|nr:acyl-CoA thioesterase [Candidatus Neomarinimicrobiota bacterium]